jgi:type VI secretion system FHA domain protein
MLLALSIVSDQGGLLGNAAYKVFDERGGSIGRVAGNDWVLPDPQNFVSSKHARVSANAGVFFLEDTSSNGTFINAPDRLASRTEPQRLADGDRLYIGDYEIIVQLIPSAAGEMVTRAPAPQMSDAPTRLQGPAAARAPAPMQNGGTPAAFVAYAPTPLMSPPTPPPTPPLMSPPMPPPSALGLGTVDPLAALGALAAPHPVGAGGVAAAARSSAPGMADPLAALGRATPNGADPLAVLDDASSGPLAALGLDTARLDGDTQAALLAGLRAGFNALLTKLHPERLEDLFERKLKRTAVLGIGSNKAKYWDLYRGHFEDLERDREAHFRQLFGEEFALAFNDQLQKLAAAARLRGR